MEVVVFDLDDTLVVEEESARVVFTATCRLAHDRCGIDSEQLQAPARRSCRALWHAFREYPYCLSVGIGSWEGLWAEFLGESRNLEALREWAPTYRVDSWRNALKQCGVDDAALAAELAGVFVNERRKLHKVYDDVFPVLDLLRGTCRLGLLTNGAPDLQRRKMAGAGLAGVFEEAVISCDVGIGKPDERVSEVLLSRFGVRSDACVMVGNSLKSDIRPAQAIGMKGVWVNRAGSTGDTEVTPDREVQMLAELPAWLSTF